MDTMANYQTVEQHFDWDIDPSSPRLSSSFVGLLPAAVKKGDRLLPGMRAQKWNTFEPVEEATGGIAFDDGYFAGQRWAARVRGGQPAPGATLYGKLLDADDAGTELVTFTSKINDDGNGTYAYQYTVTNSTKARLRFKWAGLSQVIQPGKSFSHEVKSPDLTAAVSETAWFVVEPEWSREGPWVLYTITAHFWKCPQNGAR